MSAYDPIKGLWLPTVDRPSVYPIIRNERDERRDEPITVTLWDSVTGATLENSGGSEWWWTDGNGSCDCNRAILFDHDEVNEDYCDGCHRYYVVAVSRGDLSLFNSGYPPIPDGVPCR